MIACTISTSASCTRLAGHRAQFGFVDISRMDNTTSPRDRKQSIPSNKYGVRIRTRNNGGTWRGNLYYEGNTLHAGTHPTEDQAAIALSKYASQAILPANCTCLFWCFWLSVVLDLDVLPAGAFSCPQRHSIDVSLLPNSNVSTGRCTRLASLAMACLSCQMPRRQSWMLCPWSSCWKGSRQHPGSSPLDCLPTGE